MLVFEPNVKHQIAALPGEDLTRRNLVLFPSGIFIRRENRVGRELLPLNAVDAFGVPDRVRLVLVAGGVPHLEDVFLVVPKDVRAHRGALFPSRFRNQDRFALDALPLDAVVAYGEPDSRTVLRLAGVPHIILAVFFQDGRPVDANFPTAFRVGRQDDARFRPLHAIAALRVTDRFFRPPREPHLVRIAFFEKRYVEADAQIAAENRVCRMLDPAARRFGVKSRRSKTNASEERQR